MITIITNNLIAAGVILVTMILPLALAARPGKGS